MEIPLYFRHGVYLPRYRHMNYKACKCGPVVCSTRVLVVGPPWLIIFQVYPMDGQSVWDLGNFEVNTRSSLSCSFSSFCVKWHPNECQDQLRLTEVSMLRLIIVSPFSI